MRHDLVAMQPQGLQAGQRFVQIRPGRAKLAERQLHMGASYQCRTQMPLQVGGARDDQRAIEVRQGAPIVSQPHMTGASPAYHHQVLRFIALVPDAARQVKGTRERDDRRGRFGVGEIRFPPTMKRLHGDQVRQAQTLANIHRLLVIRDRQIVTAIAPGHRPQVIQGIGRMAFITHGTRRLERLVQTDNSLLVGVGASIGHAELNQHVACMFVLAQRARRFNHVLKVGHRTLDLAGLHARHATPLVQGELLRWRCRVRMGLQQRHGAIKPLQRFAHRKQLLCVLGGQTQVKQRLGPHVAALIVLGQAGVVLMRCAFRVLLQPLCQCPVQQHAPGHADIPVHHLSHLVVTEIIEAAFLILTQKPTLDQRLHRVQKALLGYPGQRQQSLEIEATPEHRRHVEQRPIFMRHTGQASAHRVTQGVRQRQAARIPDRAFAFAQRMQDRPEEERIAVSLTVQSGGEIGRT